MKTTYWIYTMSGKFPIKAACFSDAEMNFLEDYPQFEIQDINKIERK